SPTRGRRCRGGCVLHALIRLVRAMRIAVVASPVAPLRPARPGGAQAMVCDLALGLVHRGHRVAIHCVEGSEVPGVDLITVPPPRDAAQALVMPLGRPAPQAPGVAAAIAEMFDAIRSTRPDVVSQHAFDAPAFDHARGLAALRPLHRPPPASGAWRCAWRVPATIPRMTSTCKGPSLWASSRGWSCGE